MRHIVTASSVPLLTQQILEEKALDLAELHGLQGVPDTQKAVFITLGEWYTLNDAELGKDASQIGLTSDVPVFVLAIQGNVEWHGPGLPNPNQDRQEHYDNITVVLNARTAELVWVGSKYAGFTMPVPVD